MRNWSCKAGYMLAYSLASKAEQIPVETTTVFYRVSFSFHAIWFSQAGRIYSELSEYEMGTKPKESSTHFSPLLYHTVPGNYTAEWNQSFHSSITSNNNKKQLKVRVNYNTNTYNTCRNYKRPAPGFEPGTSCTQSRNHTTRPRGHATCAYITVVNILI